MCGQSAANRGPSSTARLAAGTHWSQLALCRLWGDGEDSPHSSGQAQQKGTALCEGGVRELFMEAAGTFCVPRLVLRGKRVMDVGGG